MRAGSGSEGERMMLLHAMQVMTSWVERRMTSGAALSEHEKEDWKARRRGVGARCWDKLWEARL